MLLKQRYENAVPFLIFLKKEIKIKINRLLNDVIFLLNRQQVWSLFFVWQGMLHAMSGVVTSSKCK